MRGASGFIPSERLYLAEQPHLIEAHSQEVKLRAPQCTDGFRSFWRASIFPLCAALAICVALVAVASVCSQHRVKGLEVGVPKRSLAGEDAEPFDSPPSPELEQLCRLLGPWIPAEPPPGNLRQSPHMVEEFFEEIEADDGTEAAPPVPEGAATAESLTGAAIGGPRAETAGTSGGPDDEKPGPSWRFPTFQGRQPASQHAQFCRTHPFVRLPHVQPGVKPRPWAFSVSPFSTFTPSSSQQLMFRIRELLLLSSLNAQAAEKLMTAVEQLAAYSIRRLSAITPPTRPADAVEKYGRRFLVLDAIYSAAQAIGPPQPPWWQGVVEATLKGCQCDPSASLAKRPTFCGFLARDLAAALQKYKNGDFPTPEEALHLKRQLLCDKRTPTYFLRPEWDPWREDDKRA